MAAGRRVVAGKDAVFGKVYRILRLGGRMSVADSVVARGDMSAWVGCVAGAIPEQDYLSKLRAVGFSDAEIVYRDDKTEPGMRSTASES